MPIESIRVSRLPDRSLAAYQLSAIPPTSSRMLTSGWHIIRTSYCQVRHNKCCVMGAVVVALRQPAETLEDHMQFWPPDIA